MKIPYDKLMHFTAGAVVGAVAGVISGSAAVALLAAVVVAIGKEVYDNIVPGHDVELLDAVSTVAGGSLSAVLVHFINSMG